MALEGNFRQISSWDKLWSHRVIRTVVALGTIAIFLTFGGLDIIARLVNEASSLVEVLERIMLTIWYLFSSHRVAQGIYFFLNGAALTVSNRFLLTRRFRDHRRAMRDLTEISHLGIFLRVHRMREVQVSVVTLLLYSILFDYHLVFVTFHAIVFYAWGWIRTSVPPAVLLLAQSDDRGATQLHWQLRGAVDPLRVVSFLGYYRPDGKHSPPSRVELDCLRSRNPDDWWECVTDVMEMACIIVIDGQSSSDGLVQEAVFIMRGPLVHKTLFISRADGGCPLLDRLDDIDHRGAVVLNQHNVIRVVGAAFDRDADPKHRWPEFRKGDLARIKARV